VEAVGGAPPPPGVIRLFYWQSDRVVRRVRPDADCPRHEPPGPDEPAEGGPCVDVLPPADAKECKIYRRVDDGPLTLVHRFEVPIPDANPDYCDGAVPANAARLCYYAQCFDEHGNASPLTRLECLDSAGRTPLPTPTLARLKAVDPEATPRMRIRWFCPPYGVERFRIAIAAGLDGVPETISPDLSNDLVPRPNHRSEFETHRIGGGFGNGGEFEVTVPVAPDETYRVSVQAVGPGGFVDDTKWSNEEEFHWRRPPIELAPGAVPWPQRPLPDITATFHPEIVAQRLRPPAFDGVGVRIGTVDLANYTPATSRPIRLRGLPGPLDAIYKNEADQPLLPVALYRYQVTNTFFPMVSGDVAQVSPLMESIAHTTRLGGDGVNEVSIYDPFITVVPRAGSTVADIYLLDTQPVVANAAYRYLLVRLRAPTDPAPGEIDQVIPTNAVEVTP
jgi:hypothetical protein